MGSVTRASASKDLQGLSTLHHPPTLYQAVGNGKDMGCGKRKAEGSAGDDTER